MTLASRLLLATLLLAFGITLAFAWLTKRTWERAEGDRFEAEFQRAIAGLEQDLARARSLAQGRLQPLCAHGTMVDSTLAGLESDTLGSRLLSIKLALEEERRALGLRELALMSDRAELLAGSWRGRSKSSAQRTELDLLTQPARTQLRTEPELAFEIACKRTDGGRSAFLLAAIAVEPLLVDAGERHNLRLRLLPSEQAAERSEGDLVETVKLAGLEGRIIEARRSRSDLARLLGEVEVALLTVTLVVLAFATFAALFLARSLSRPVRLFAQRTRDVLRGSVEPLPITGGRELEQAARAFNQALSDLNTLRERLALTERIVARREVARQVAHEVNNPLMPIRTSIETLRKLKTRDSAAFDSYFDEASGIVLSEVNRLARMVESFSAYARLPDPKLEHFDLAALCEQLASLFGQAAEARGVTVHVRTPGPTPVFADRDQLSQAVTNLIKNAVEAALEPRPSDPSPGPAARNVWVTVSATAAPDSFSKVMVEDDGPGIPPSEFPRLLTPYETTKTGGTGLGLPITQRIAVEHGGDLTYASRPAGGATFTLTLKTTPGPSPKERSERADFL